MKTMHLRHLAAAVALPLLATACNDPAEPREQLTKEEATALFTSLYPLPYDTTRFKLVGVSGDSVVVSCPQGGRARAVAVITDTTRGDTVQWNVNLSIAPDGCKLTGGGSEFTLDGDPNVGERLTIDFLDDGTFSSTGSYAGGLGWELDGRSGSCEIDLKAAGEESTDSGLKHVHKGTLCGHQVDEVTTYIPVVSTGPE